MRAKDSSLGQAIRIAANERDSQNTSIPENQPEEAANLTIKVNRRHRIHWMTEARKQDTTLTAVIIKALEDRFGKPE